MVYIKRDSNNKIVAIYGEKTSDVTEEIAQDDKEVIEFLSSCNLDNQSELVKSDLDMIRVVEDLVQILIAKNVIAITDFPIAAIQKLSQRGKIRSEYTGLSDIVDKL
ncbi:MAG: hypothetical protein P1U74_09235 [Legionellaceae bacterium]|nr:hypothetical protein [Legionellaceae bacterium]